MRWLMLSSDYFAPTLNPIAERTAVIGLDGAIRELVETLGPEERTALRKLSPILQSNQLQDLPEALSSTNIQRAGRKLAIALMAQALGWKGEVI